MCKKVYLVADASLPQKYLVKKFTKCFESGLNLLQLYNTQKCSSEWLNSIADLANLHKVNVVIYNDVDSVISTKIKAIHLDEVEDIIEVEKNAGKLTYKGVTVGNDLTKIAKAEELGYDYISFCSLFPTTSANVCDFVNFETIKQARNVFSKEIFLAGGITVSTVKKLKELDYDGIVAISAIFESDNIAKTIQTFKNQ